MKNIPSDKQTRKRIQKLTRMLNELCESLEEKSNDPKLIHPVEMALIRDVKGLESWREKQREKRNKK